MSWWDRRRKRIAQSNAAWEQQQRNERVAEAIKILEEEGTSQEAMSTVIVILAKEQAANKNMAWVRKARAILEPLYAQIFKRRNTSNGKRKINTQTSENTTQRGSGNQQAAAERSPAPRSKIEI